MQHLLSRGRCDDQAMLDAILIVDETSDEKPTSGCADAARQYCGDNGSIALYLPADWAADEERRELAGVPGEVMFATKPELAAQLLKQAHDRGIGSSFVVGDEVDGGLDLSRSIRGLGSGYVMAVRSNHMVTLPSGRRITVKTAGNLVRPSMWQRMRTGSAAKGAGDYHEAMIEARPGDPSGTMTGTPSCSCAGTTTPAPSATTCAGARARSRWSG